MLKQLLSLLGLDRDEGQPSLIDDLRSGRAGLVPRVSLSIALAGAILAIPMFIFGLIEVTDRRVDDQYIAIGVCLAGAIWCGSMIAIWSTYRRWQRVIRTIFAVIGIWIIIIPLCVVIDNVTYRADFFIATGILSGIALTILFIVTAAYRSRGGRYLRGKAGMVVVNCPQCGYSLVGLKSCRCPECGLAFTLDELIDAQDYGALRDPGREIEPGGRPDPIGFSRVPEPPREDYPRAASDS